MRCTLRKNKALLRRSQRTMRAGNAAAQVCSAAFTLDNEALQARNVAALISNDSLSTDNKADAVCSGTL